MALHCAATMVLVPAGTVSDDAAVDGALVVGPLAPGAHVVEELQALADLHRGERVVVPVGPDGVATVLEHLGRAPRTDEGATLPLRLEIGDDGWALLPAAD